MLCTATTTPPHSPVGGEGFPALPESGALATLLHGLSAHARGLGACLVFLHPDGSLGWHDLSAGVFFDRYVIPGLRGPGIEPIRQSIAAPNPNSKPEIIHPLPGLTCAI